MPLKRFTSEQIIGKLREAEVRLGQGQPLPEYCRALAAYGQTFYRWRKEFGALNPSQVQRLKVLERANDPLGSLVDLSLATQELKTKLANVLSGRPLRLTLQVRHSMGAGHWRFR